MSKLTDPEYRHGALNIVIQWYADLLDKQVPRGKNQEASRKLRSLLAEANASGQKEPK